MTTAANTNHPTTKFRIVTMVEGQLIAQEPTDIHAWAEVCSVAIQGYNTNHRQRAELQGQPKLAGFCGPMWDGNGVIRYESTEAYRSLSA